MNLDHIRPLPGSPAAEYRGMTGEQASREGMRLLQEAVKTGNWRMLPEKLATLRNILVRPDPNAC